MLNRNRRRNHEQASFKAHKPWVPVQGRREKAR
jgi:hypothetical protein